MNEHLFRQTIANNLIYYRKAAKLTQHDLAEMLCYTDKSISKWERAEGLPDIITLSKIAEIYNVTVNDLISEKHKKAKTVYRLNKVAVSAISCGLVWLIAVMLYVALKLILEVENDKFWLCFVYAVPISMIVLIVFSSIWSKKWVIVLFISIFIWTFLLSLFFTLTKPNIWLLFLIGIPLQIIALLWLFVRIPPKWHFWRTSKKEAKKVAPPLQKKKDEFSDDQEQ